MSVQLLVTLGFVALFTFIDGPAEFISENVFVFYIAIAISFACVIALSCYVRLARSYPTNIIFLAIFTLAESLIVGFIAAFFAVEDVFIAVGVTAAVVFGLTLFACQTKYDFTGWGPYLFVALLVVLLFSLILIFIQESREVRTIFAVLVVLLFSMFLVYDTQLVIGGKHKKFQFSVDDYVFAALSLYLDIINIFLYLLIIFGGGDG